MGVVMYEGLSAADWMSERVHRRERGLVRLTQCLSIFLQSKIWLYTVPKQYATWEGQEREEGASGEQWTRDLGGTRADQPTGKHRKLDPQVTSSILVGVGVGCLASHRCALLEREKC